MMKPRNRLLFLSAALTSAAVSVPRAYGDEDGGVATVMAEIKKIETGISQRLESRLAEIKAGMKVEERDAKLASLEKAHADATAELKGMITEVEKKLGRPGVGGEGPGEHRTSGRQFIESEEFKNRPRGRNRMNITMEQKALTTASNSAGVLLDPQILPNFQAPIEPHVRDLIPSGETSSKTLKFRQRKTKTNNAAMVAEGGLKPQSDMTFEMVSFDVKKIAHFVKESDELLEDEPALSSYIESQLIDGLRDVEDAQILKGDGTGNNLLGLYPQAAAYDAANYGQSGDTLIDMYMGAFTQLRMVNRTASGIVLNPMDWLKIQRLKGTDGHYIWVNVLDGNGQPRLLAVPVRDTTKLNPGEWLVGDFKRGAQLFDRKQATISVANQNEDDFTHNLITILAEERLALVTYDRLSFVKNAPISN